VLNRFFCFIFFFINGHTNQTLFLPLRQCFILTRMRRARARFNENFFMSAQRGAACLRRAINFIFFPNGFLFDILSTFVNFDGFLLSQQQRVKENPAYYYATLLVINSFLSILLTFFLS
jgi:hypothetical protein